MMGLLGDLLRRARLRGLAEGQVQKVRAESLENKAHDEAERFQDYGFAANPVEGQGLVLSVAGHTIVLRMDRLAERPQLAAHEVCIWHKEGHKVTLKAGKVIEVECDEYSVKTKRYKVQASEGVALTGPSVKHNGSEIGSPHTHGGVSKGNDRTSTPG